MDLVVGRIEARGFFVVEDIEIRTFLTVCLFREFGVAVNDRPAVVRRKQPLVRVDRNGRLVQGTSYTELVREPSLSCVLFRRTGWTSDDYRDWTFKNHKSGFALVAPTKRRTSLGAETVARFCFINPDTTEKDIADILATME